MVTLGREPGFVVGSSGLVFGVRFQEGFLGPEWGALERYVLVVCLEVAQFLTLDLEARASLACGE